MPEMGTSPMAVRATTSAEPLSRRSTFDDVVNVANNWENAVWSNARRVCFSNERSKGTTLPVETPPLAAVCGRRSCHAHVSYLGPVKAREIRTSAAPIPPLTSVIFSLLCTTCKEKPKGFLYCATTVWELAIGANASLSSVMTSSKSDMSIDWMTW